jgi:hypothetical protein
MCHGLSLLSLTQRVLLDLSRLRKSLSDLFLASERLVLNLLLSKGSHASAVAGNNLRVNDCRFSAGAEFRDEHLGIALTMTVTTFVTGTTLLLEHDNRVFLAMGENFDLDRCVIQDRGADLHFFSGEKKNGLELQFGTNSGVNRGDLVGLAQFDFVLETTCFNNRIYFVILFWLLLGLQM